MGPGLFVQPRHVFLDKNRSTNFVDNYLTDEALSHDNVPPFACFADRSHDISMIVGIFFAICNTQSFPVLDFRIPVSC
jgi:hypothetical protein